MNTYFLPTGIAGIVRVLLVSAMLACVLGSATSTYAEPVYLEAPEGSPDDIEIVAGEDKTVFEYRNNGVLMMIKVVPKKGTPYYMVPADGSAHYERLDHSKKLYPSWVILEW